MNTKTMTTQLFTQETVQSIPLFAPSPQTAMEHHPPKETYIDIPFVPDPRQVLVNRLFRVIKTPVREFQVLQHHGNVAVVFFLPHGFISYREVQQGPTIQEELEALRQEMDMIRSGQEEMRQLVEGVQERHRRQQERIAREEQQRRRTLPAPSVIDLDPIIPIASLDLGERFNVCLRQLAFNLVYWQVDYSLQEHQAWGERVSGILTETQRALSSKGARDQLNNGEYQFISHFLDLCVANPAIWKPSGV